MTPSSTFNESIEGELDEAAIEMAADALGVGLETLRTVAEHEEFMGFRSELRRLAARRMKSSAEAADPFDWDGSDGTAEVAFVEDRALVELLYASLRGVAMP